MVQGPWSLVEKGDRDDPSGRLTSEGEPVPNCSGKGHVGQGLFLDFHLPLVKRSCGLGWGRNRFYTFGLFTQRKDISLDFLSKEKTLVLKNFDVKES